MGNIISPARRGCVTQVSDMTKQASVKELKLKKLKLKEEIEALGAQAH